MADHISIRDVQFTPSTEGVRIIVVTDVPCHLYCRLSLKEPWIHKKPSLRRGVQFAEDVRFCFTVYEDNEQHEAGETLLHTFWKPDWPVCTTKWCYFWGTVAGTASVSTSPFFKYHNDGISPVPVPEVMLTFNSIEPQLRSPGSGDVWKTMDLSHEIPAGCSGAIVQIQNIDISQPRKCGLRKPGSTTDRNGYLRDGNYTWGLVGCDDDRKVEAFAPDVATMLYWIMGYTGPNVHFLDEAVEIPLVEQVWNDIDCSPYVPANVDAVIFNVSCSYAAMGIYAIRKKGSTDVHYGYFQQNFPILGLDANFKAEIWPRAVGGSNVRLFLTGYIVGGITMHTNSIDISPPILGSWQGRLISAYNATTHFAIIETCGAQSPVPWGVRKGASLRPILGNIRDHQWCYPHCNHGKIIDIYRSIDTMHFYEIGVVE